MRRRSARVMQKTVNTNGAETSPLWAAAGFALGALTGWVIGEVTGRFSRDRLSSYVVGLRRPPVDTGAPSTPRERVRAALNADPDLARLDLEVVAAGRGAVELHGWVPSRTLRARATRLAATAAGHARLIDSLLVRGEDDRPQDEDDGPAEAPQSA